MDQLIVTTEGLEKMNAELAECYEKRKRIAAKIEYAKSLGDLSENFEYQEAKEDQSFNETRILELEDMVKRAIIAEAPTAGVINLGSTVTVDLNGTAKSFKIVSFNEADPMQGRVSNESPIGQALLGRQVGESVVVQTPKGPMTYKIKRVEE